MSLCTHHKKISLSLSLSCWPSLFVFTLHILLCYALICSTFQAFYPTVSFPSPFCQSTILLSPPPPPPRSSTDAMSPPPQEMNDWQVCSAGNIRPDNKREGYFLDFQISRCCNTLPFSDYSYQLYHVLIDCFFLPFCLSISSTCLVLSAEGSSHRWTVILFT